MSHAQARADSWFARLAPLAAAAIALVVLILAPLWAYRWYRLPFTGMFLEPNLVVSAISEPDWPAARLGVSWSDRLLQVNDQPVATIRQYEAAIRRNGFDPVRLQFERRSGSRYQVVFTPRAVEPSEFFAHFGIPYLVGLLFLASGWWSYRMSDRGRAARAFLVLGAAGCVNMSSFLDMNTTHAFLLAWALSLPIVAGSLAHLALVFPQPMPFVERWPSLRFSPWSLAALISLPIVRDLVLPRSPWDYILSWRLGYLLMSAAMVFMLAILLVRLFTSTSPVVRQQSRIIIFGAALAFGPILFLYFFPSIFGGRPRFVAGLYVPPLIILPFSLAYSIVRYRMLDVDRALSRVVSYGLITLASFGLFYLLVAVISLVIQSQFNPNNPLILASYLFLLVALFNPLRELASRAIDRLFYRTRADYRRVLTTLSRDLVVTPNLEQTWQLLEREILLALNPQRVELYLYDDDHRLYLPYHHQLQAELAVSQEHPLVMRLGEASNPLWIPPGKNGGLGGLLPGRVDNQVFAPLRYENRLVGFLALSARRSGEPYNRDDLEFLGAVAAQSSLAVENARLFTNLQRTLDQALEMKNLMGDIFASIASGVITTDLQGKITLFNPAAERILGLPAGQVLGEPIGATLAGMCPDLGIMAVATLMEGATLLGEEVEPQLPERGQVHLRLSATPLLDARGVINGSTVVIDDLTEQRRVEADRERIRQTFGRVVAPRVRDRLLADAVNLHMDGEKHTITVMFADISEFTHFSEHTPPDKLFQVLNSYLSLAARAVLEEEGTLDKFVGDAVMAFWNAPDRQEDHALRAVRAALAMDAAFRQHREQAADDEKLEFCIGIASGEAMIGNVGTADLFNYTAIGDTVNLAQRLEVSASPGQILLSESTYNLIREAAIARPLDPIKVKGRDQIVRTYSLEGLRSA